MSLLEIVITLATVFINTYVAYFVYRSDRRNIVNTSFALFIFLVAMWVLSSIGLYVFPSAFTGTLTLALGLSIGISFVLFARVYPSSSKDNSLIFYLPIPLLFLIVFAGAYSGLLLESVQVEEGIATPKFGPLYPIFLLLYMSILPYSIYNLIKKFRQSNSVERLKMQYLTIAVICFVLTVSVFNGILPAVGYYGFVQLGLSLASIWGMLIAYTILQRRLFGVGFMFGKVLYYLVWLVIPLAAFGVFYVIGNYLYGIDVSELPMIFIVFFWGAVGYILMRFASSIDQLINIRFLYGNYDPSKVIDSLVEVIDTELRMKNILKYAETLLKDIYKTSIVGFVVIQDGVMIESDSTSRISDVFKEKLQRAGEIKKWIKSFEDNLIIREELELASRKHVQDEFISTLKSLNISLFGLLYQKNDIDVWVYMGDKEDRQVYTAEDLKLLKRFFLNLSIGLERALLYQQVSDFNVSLQQKINKATEELQEKNTQLEETLRKERDMMDILGHELRTPLTIGKNAMKILKKKHEKEGKIDNATLDKYLEMADENLSREAKLLETLLSTTKIDNNAVDLHFEKVDLIDVVNDSLDAHEPKAKDKGLEITFEPPKEAYIYADRNRMQEVVDNLIDNAIKYTKEGLVTIEINPAKDMTEVKVIDSGVGIPKEDLDKLGQKFYRINTYLDSSKKSDYKVVRPGGTGLGLYVTFNLVELMDGKITVDSEVGKGSIFSVQIPTFSGQEVKDNGKGNGAGKTVFEKFEEMKNKS